MIEIIGGRLTQWDHARKVKASESEATHVHLANPGDVNAAVMKLENGEALVPDYLLHTGKAVLAYAVLNGVTLEIKSFPVRKREKPEGYVYEEDTRNYIYAVIAEAEKATEAANKAADAAHQAVQETLDVNVTNESVTKALGYTPASQNDLEVERARINTFTSLPEGSTAGDAELADARIDKDGKTHANVGEHIRSVSSNLSEQIVYVGEGYELLTPTTNKFNPETATDGYIAKKDGLVETPNYCCSDFIEVDGSKTYTFRGKYAGDVQIVLYDENKTYIKQLYENQVTSGSHASGSLTLDLSIEYPNTRYVIVNMTNNDKATYMFVEGETYPSEYTEYDEVTEFKNSVLTEVIEKIIHSIIFVGNEKTIAGTPQQTISIGNNACSDEELGSIAIGNESLKNSETDGTDNGKYNVAVGHQAMRDATIADHSTAIGYQAMKHVTTGDYNTAMGEDALMVIGSGSRNVAVGCRAMQSQTSGDDNVAVGALARYFTDATNPTGSRNVAIGTRSGDSDGNGNDCTHIGYGAKNETAGLNNTITIGSNARATKDNQTVIGNSNTTETLVRGDLVVRGTDGIRRRIIFNPDYTCCWEIISE